MKKLALTIISAVLLAGLLPAPFLALDILSAQQKTQITMLQLEGETGEPVEELGEPEEPEEGEEPENLGEGEEQPEPEMPDEQTEQDGRARLAEISAEREIMALVYLSDEYTVRAQPDVESDAVATVLSGQQVLVKDACFDENGGVWVYAAFVFGDTEYTGYIQRENIACSDERFLQWEQDFGFSRPARQARVAGTNYADIEQFPESYRASLIALKNAHPNWTFVKQNTVHDWNTSINGQMNPKNRSLIWYTFDDYMKDGVYDKNWCYASRLAVEYYMDPRNWLTETHIFQFEQLTYNKSYHTEAAVQSILNGSFMSGNIPLEKNRTYANVFFSVGRELGVSPYHLASRAYFEQGVNGTSALISGKYPGYENLYNYYNIGASGANEQVVINGLTRARKEGWNTPYKSIEGGAKIISKYYILAGQDTLYLQKYAVGNGNYGHQYMQSVYAPSSEGAKIRNAYQNVGAINNKFVFKIPVFKGMPSKPCVLPSTSFKITLTPPDGYTDPKIYLDGVEYAAKKDGSKYTVTAPGVNVGSAVMYKYNKSGVPVGMYVWLLEYKDKKYTAKAMPELENLLTYHGFSVRITGKAGIRFKTGISTDTRKKLTGGGISGYKLVEYGTLVMTEANKSKYPFILGGNKVGTGRAYGKNSSGKLEDFVYETVDGRYRYTSVLVGLPPEQYKTNFAFRGYLVLTKDGKNTIIYGPPVAKNISDLAQQALNSGQYAKGSDAYKFLKKIIDEAK